MPNIDPYATNVLNGELAQDAVLEEAYNTVDGWEIGLDLLSKRRMRKDRAPAGYQV